MRNGCNIRVDKTVYMCINLVIDIILDKSVDGGAAKSVCKICVNNLDYIICNELVYEILNSVIKVEIINIAGKPIYVLDLIGGNGRMNMIVDLSVEELIYLVLDGLLICNCKCPCAV